MASRAFERLHRTAQCDQVLIATYNVNVTALNRFITAKPVEDRETWLEIARGDKSITEKMQELSYLYMRFLRGPAFLTNEAYRDSNDAGQSMFILLYELKQQNIQPYFTRNGGFSLVK